MCCSNQKASTSPAKAKPILAHVCAVVQQEVPPEVGHHGGGPGSHQLAAQPVGVQQQLAQLRNDRKVSKVSTQVNGQHTGEPPMSCSMGGSARAHGPAPPSNWCKSTCQQ